MEAAETDSDESHDTSSDDEDMFMDVSDTESDSEDAQYRTTKTVTVPQSNGTKISFIRMTQEQFERQQKEFQNEARIATKEILQFENERKIEEDYHLQSIHKENDSPIHPKPVRVFGNCIKQKYKTDTRKMDI